MPTHLLHVSTLDGSALTIEQTDPDRWATIRDGQGNVQHFRPVDLDPRTVPGRVFLFAQWYIDLPTYRRIRRFAQTEH